MATIKDCTCPICLCIMIEPVTMPCKHSICLPCYKQTVEKANLCCPLCRLRISVWARKSAKAGTLVDSAKWDAIRKDFPVQVEKRLEGKEMFDDDDDSESYETRLRQLMALSKPGEIRQEYEAELQKIQRRRQEEAKVEEEASAALIRSLQQEEEEEKEALERLKEEQDRLDREIAEKLQETFVAEDDDDLLVESEPLAAPVTTSNGSSKSLNKTAVSKLNKGKCKQLKQTPSNNLTMATFFSPVPREAGVTSPIRGSMTRNKLLGGHSDAGMTTHSFVHDVDPCENGSHIPALKTETLHFSFLEFLKHEHSSCNISVKDATGNSSLEDHTAGGEVASRANQKLETVDRFAAGPSGVGRCDIISAAFSEVRTQVPTNTAHEISGSKHVRIMLQPLEICSRMSSTQVSSYSVNDPLGKSAANKSTRINTVHLGVASSKAGSFFNTDQERVNPCSSQLQTSGVECSSNQKASVLSYRNTFEDLSEGFVESSILSEDTELESNQTLLAPGNIDSTSLKGEVQTTCDNVKLAVNPASMSGFFNKPDDPLSESGDGSKMKCNDDVNDLKHADDVCANDYDSVDSSCTDTTEIESDETTKCDSDDTLQNDSDTCIEFSEDFIPSRQQTDFLALLGKHSKMCTVNSKCNSEKENRVGIDCKHYKDMKANSKVEDRHCVKNPKAGVFKVKSHFVKKSKKSAILPMARKKTEPVVSIMQWCVPNGCQGEPKNGLKIKKDAIFDKTESEHRNGESVRSFFGKRKHPVPSDDEEKHILGFSGDKKMNDVHSDRRKEMVAKEKDEFFSNKKMLKVDSGINSLAPVRPEISAIDVLDQLSDDVDQSGISQEEKDHLMAIQLQEMYSRLDKNNIPVDRFKGSKDHYMLRKKTLRK